MNADKRQVTTDALETLGTIIGESEARDAIHLAVEPAIAAHTLRPGEDVGFINAAQSEVGVCENPVGIVDPFLKQAVQKGQRFWLVVYPRQITSLRHVWTHPAFDGQPADALTPKPEPASDSEQWMRDYANDTGVGYEELLIRARDYLRNGNYWSEGGRFEGEYLPDEFWDHYEKLTGEEVPDDERGSFFSCSC